MTSSQNSSEVDKYSLYGSFLNWQDAREKLGLKAAHKALDIPDDDMNVNADNSRHGIGTLGAIAIAAIAAGVPWLAGAFDRPSPQPPPPIIQTPSPPPEPVKPPVETKTERHVFDWRVGTPEVR